MGRIKIILFDLGNVIAHIDFDAFWRSVGFVTPQEIAPLKEGYKTWTLQYETGHIPTSEYLDGLAKVFGHRFTNEHLERAVASIIREPVEGMAELIMRISKTQQTALVSNTNEIHYHLSLKRFAVLQIFHKHYLSYKLRVMKPASGFYEAIIKDLNILPSEMLFLDDLISNVEGARLAGMQAIKFETRMQLEVALKTLHVLM
jgi:HAD superfamily hydrolase (TIGR01509 family)